MSEPFNPICGHCGHHCVRCKCNSIAPQMSEENKAREFWLWSKDLDFDLGMKNVSAAEYPHNDSKPHCLHVIEYSAYQLENKKRNEAIALSSKFESELAEARAENVELGKVYRSTCPECGYDGCVRGKKACDTQIERLEKERDSLEREVEVLRFGLTEIANTPTNGDCFGNPAVAQLTLRHADNIRKERGG